MKRTILLLCVLSVLALATGTVLAQNKGQGKERGGTAGPKKAGETAKADANAPAAGKKAMSPEDMEKMAKEKGKGATERGQGQAREKAEKGEKGGKGQVADKMAEAKAKGKGQEQQMRAFEKQMQHETAKHLEQQARLTRLRELAVQKGDTKKVALIDELIAKEKKVYDSKLQKMQAQKRAGGTEPMTAPLPKEGGKGKDKDKDKDKEKGKAEGEKSAEKSAGETAKPAEPQTPPPAAQPAPAQKPAEAPKAAEAPKPAETPKPATPEPNAPKPQ